MILIWRTDTGKCIQRLKGHGVSVRSIAVSHDAALIAAASGDKTIQI
jgi:WD40 repeat protein